MVGSSDGLVDTIHALNDWSRDGLVDTIQALKGWF